MRKKKKSKNYDIKGYRILKKYNTKKKNSAEEQIEVKPETSILIYLFYEYYLSNVILKCVFYRHIL